MMTLLGWLKMGLVFDLALAVFVFALVWKTIKIKKELSTTQRNLEIHKAFCIKLSERIDLQSSAIVEIGDNLISVVKNPQAARRELLKQKKELQDS